MNLRTHTRALVALTLVAITVSGCSNSSGGAATTVAEASSSGQVTSTPGVDSRTPLTVYLDSLYGLNGSTEDQQHQRTAKKTRQE
jgi:hypothetical protein